VKERRRLASVGMTGMKRAGKIVARRVGRGASPAPTNGNTASAAVDGGVADVLALDDVDDVFGDVGGVVADAFEIFGDED
jgi:hypothetical protein